MKTILTTITLGLLTMSLHAEFRTWTNSDGKVAELDLQEVKEVDGEKVGSFKMRNGTKVTLKKSELSEEDSKALEIWTPGLPSVFDEVLTGNLEHLDGDKLVAKGDFSKPNKYYIFYYTASWCGPCQRYTPSLVEWYKSNKNSNFDIVLISSDRSKEAMEGYTKSKKMPWPHLKFSKSKTFKGKYDHGVRGIPALIVCDLEGKVLGNYRGRHQELTELVKD